MTYHPILDLDVRASNLRRLTRRDLNTTSQLWDFNGNWQGNKAYQGHAAMQLMGLAMYEYEGYHLIGFTDAKQHPHDRWLFKTNGPIGPKRYAQYPATAFDSPSWVRLHRCCDGPDGTDIKVADVSAHLMLMKSSVIFKHPRSGATSYQEGARQLRLLGSAAFEILPASLDLHGKITYVRAHELLHHWENWQTAKPESAGLPQGLALRMHGLAKIVETGILSELAAA